MRSVVTLLTITALSGFAHSADDPAITVWAGAGGYVRDDCVAPVFVLLDNSVTQRDGYVSVQFSTLGAVTAEARRDVELPPNSRKGVFLYVPNMGNAPDQVTVTYHNARGRHVNSVQERLRSVDQWLPVVAAVGALPGGLPAHESENGDGLYTRLILDSERLPRDGIGLEMFDAIIVSPPPQTALTRQQVDALRDWLLRGGTLIVDTSERSEGLVQGSFASLLPFVPDRIASLELSVLGTTETIAEGSLHSVADTLLESDGRPLIVRRNFGLGSVTTFAIPPDARGMKKWEGREAVWKDILHGLYIAEPKRGISQQVDQLEEVRRTELMNNARAKQQTGLRLGLVLALTLLYALVVGPGDYFFIKWIGKPKLTWVTFPAIVIVFTAAAWWGAKAWVGGDMSSMHVRRTIVFPELATATQYDVMGLFVPAGRRYTVNHQPGGHLQEIRSTLAPGETGVYDVDEKAIVQRIPIWKSRVYGASMELDAYPPVDLRVTYVEGQTVVTLSNQSDLTLRGNTIIHMAGTWRMAKDIAPGETVELTLTVESANTRLSQAVRSLMMFGLAMQRDEQWAHGRQFDIRDALHRGAYVFVSDDTGISENPLVVDGEVRPEPGRELLQIVTYARSAP